MSSVPRFRSLDSTPSRNHRPLASRISRSPSLRRPPFVATSTSSLRHGAHIPWERRRSPAPRRYPCAVSNSVIPISTARPMVALASSVSTRPHSPPNDQVPNAIGATWSSVLPRRTRSIAESSLLTNGWYTSFAFRSISIFAIALGQTETTHSLLDAGADCGGISGDEQAKAELCRLESDEVAVSFRPAARGEVITEAAYRSLLGIRSDSGPHRYSATNMIVQICL